MPAGLEDELAELARSVQAVPSLISVTWETNGSDNHLRAIVADITRGRATHRTGQLDEAGRTSPYTKIPKSAIDTPAARALARAHQLFRPSVRNE